MTACVHATERAVVHKYSVHRGTKSSVDRTSVDECFVKLLYIVVQKANVLSYHLGVKDAFKILLFPETHIYQAESSQAKVHNL